MKKLARRLGAVLVATAAMAGMTAVVSAPAQAAGNTVYYASSDGYTGAATFYSSADVFELLDWAADGHGIVLHINLSDDHGATYHRWKNLYNPGDIGAFKSWEFDDEFSEGRYLAFRVCNQNGLNQTAYGCGTWTKATA
jgi:hypothetical protein